MSDWFFGSKLPYYLKDFEFPDIAIVSIPNIEFAYKATRFLNKNNIPYIVDVRDLHPDHVEELLRFPLSFLAKPYISN